MSEPNAAAAYHAVHLPQDPARAVVWRAIARYAARWIDPGAHVLELGAGYCDWINAVRAARRTAVDSWPGFPPYAAPGVDTLLSDAAAALRGFGAARFDVVLASNLLEHFPPDAASALIAQVATVLKARGRFIVIQPNFRDAYRQYFDDYTHRSVFTHVSLANLLRAHGFAIEACEPRFLPYSMRGTRWPVREWIVRAYLRSPIRPFAGQMLVVARRR
jgi:SAM-dependent methyltransferase